MAAYYIYNWGVTYARQLDAQSAELSNFRELLFLGMEVIGMGISRNFPCKLKHQKVALATHPSCPIDAHGHSPHFCDTSFICMYT